MIITHRMLCPQSYGSKLIVAHKGNSLFTNHYHGWLGWVYPTVLFLFFIIIYIGLEFF
jgi:hypothetical protein